MAVKPKNVEEDSWAYTMPHRIGFLIQALADNEARVLGLSKLSTSDYLERTVNRLAEEKLSSETINDVNQRAEKRTEERRRRAEEQQRIESERAAKTS